MITIYKTRTCRYCAMVAKYLQHKGVKYTEVYVDDDPPMRQDLLNRTGAMSVPITTKGNKFVVGYDIKKLAELIR